MPHIHDHTPHVSTANRRQIIQGAAALGVAMAAGFGSIAERHQSHKVAAQEVDGTRARSWDEAESIDTSIKLEGEGWVTLQTEFPYYALGFAWDSATGIWPAVQFAVSFDGVLWDEGYAMGAHDDGGPAPADDRIHTDLFFGDGQQYVRYRTVDGEGNLVILPRFQVTYIDPTDGPWEPDRASTLMRTTAVNTDTDVPPTIITRAQWGANENLRYDSLGEIWPPEYQTVEHAIVHHAAVNYGSDGYNAVRSIYYYHAVTQGWGDIGYNYVVDVRGNIFEGRVGGANVIGGHAFQYANGSSGICVMGDFTSADAPQAAKSALANIVAYTVRDLNPTGTRTFHEILNLPTICAHRDVIQSDCPGNGLYDDMAWIRSTAKSIIDTGKLDSQMPGGIVPGDWVKVQTDDGAALPLRAQPGKSQLVIASIPNGTRLEIERGPVADATNNWYLTSYSSKEGWIPADYLLVSPPTDDPMEGYSFGQNIQLKSGIPIKRSPSVNAGTVGTESSTWAFLLAGPYTAGGTKWFQILTQNGRTGWITIDQFTIAKVTAPANAYGIGKTVQTTVSSRILVRPGVGQTAQASVGAGTRLTISVDPVGVTGKTWYGVYGGTGIGGGWIDSANIAVAPQAVSKVGETYKVTESMNLRSGAGTGYSIVMTMSAGSTGTVIGGPKSANGYTWWQLRTSGGTTGWAVGNWLVATGTSSTVPDPDPTPSPTPSPTPTTGKFATGDSVRVTESLNMRSSASTSGSMVAVLASGTTGKVIGGPTTANGYTWWRIQTTAGTGWCVENWLTKTSSSGDGNTDPPATGGLAKGNTIRVTSSVNLRTDSSTSAGIIAILPAGTTGTIVGGYRTSNGYTWWKITTSAGTGWVVADWLVKTSGSSSSGSGTGTTTGKFSSGQAVKVTEALNMRSAAGTGNSLVAVLPAGTTGTIAGGPSTANGYTWWKITTSKGTGWCVQDWLTGA
ncbi:MAG: SH3 domain-containing protein [Thermomicrobiales bacterium]|nr:SH3 domain-containing protein [Thermomicrobiales bacterium]